MAKGVRRATRKVMATNPTMSDLEPRPLFKADAYLNRELTWLEFNRRVLHEAGDPRTPLIERVRFMEIFSSNLDEFFMKRVGGLKRQLEAGSMWRSADGKTAGEQLPLIRDAALPLMAAQSACYFNHIVPALAERGIHLLTWDQLADDERQQATAYFRSQVFPVLTPLAVDPGHPFPFMSNLSTSLGVSLRHPGNDDERLFARVKVPQSLPGWVQVKGTGHDNEMRFVSLLDILRHNMQALFPDMIVLSMMRFRLTRNADVERDEEDADDLLEMIEEEIRQRRFEKVVRLEHGPDIDPWMLEFLKQELDIGPEDVYPWPHDVDFRNLKPLTDLKIAGLTYEPWTPVMSQSLAHDQSMFSAIRSGDILVHHPYEDFASSVERFIRAACDDPRVRAIKMTLYRTSDDSPFIRTLIRAAEMGKQIVCLVELKARFDEEKNIYWAQALEKAGVHVVYGIVGLKTHTKISLVVREETDGLRSYVHIGTGNYNVQTARLYTDLGYFTCRHDIVEDVIELFNYLTGRSLRMDYHQLLVAPVNMKERFLTMIDREVEHAKAGRPSGIIAKQNSLEDRTMCSALYQASQAGVPIDLIVRGFCCLRPGVPNLSPTIRVRSIIGRFLEHSRIYYFRNGATDPLDGEFYIGSADWMYRNLQSRVEAITPIVDRPLRERLWEILHICLDDQRQAWTMGADGVYTQLQPKDDAHRLGTHDLLMKLTRQRKESSHVPAPTIDGPTPSTGDERKS